MCRRMAIVAVLAADDSCQIIKQFQLVGHQYVADHSSMERQTTLVSQLINSVMPIYFCWSVLICQPLFASCQSDSLAHGMSKMIH